MAVEQVNQDILKILGLEETDEIDMKSYKGFLREKLVEISMGKGNLSRDEELVVQSEFQRVKKQPDTVKVKKKKISAADIKITRPSSALVKYKKVSALSKEVKQSSDKEGTEVADKSINSNLKTINETLDKILKSIVSQGQSDRKRREKDRVSGEKRKAQERESGLEKPLQVAKNLAKKIIAPFRGILDSVFRFLGFTFLGWLVGKFDEIQKWTEQNREKITVVKRFLKDWWPSLLFAAGLFLTPFGKFVRGTIKMLRMFIPQIVKFLAAHPLLAAGAMTGLATFGAYQWKQQEDKKLIDKEAQKRGVSPDSVKAEVDEAKKSPFSMIGETLSNIGPMGYAKGGSIFGFKNGANIKKYFSGLVGNNSGTTVSGFGKDTQAFPIEGGGSAVLQPGETVLQVGARERMIRETGHDPLTFNVGPNANRPMNFTYNGGGVVGMQGGGILGMFGKPKGLGFGGVRAGFTGMAQSGYEAIMGGAKFKNPNKPSLFGKGSRPVMGHGAYNAPTMKGASRYVKPGGGIIKSIVPRGAVGNPLVDIFEPQSKVRPATFDKGKQLADKLISGKYANSPLANKLRQQLMSGQAVDTMTKVSGLGRGAALMKLLGGLGRLMNPVGLGMMGGEILSPLAIKLAEQRRKAQQERLYQLVPSGVGTMPSDGSIPTIKPLRRQGGGAVSGGTLGFTTKFGGQVNNMFGVTGSTNFGSGKTRGSASGMLGYGNTIEQTPIQKAVTEGLTSTQFGGNWGGIPYALPTSGTDVKSGLIGALNASVSGFAGTPKPEPPKPPKPQKPKVKRPIPDPDEPVEEPGRATPQNPRKGETQFMGAVQAALYRLQTQGLVDAGGNPYTGVNPSMRGLTQQQSQDLMLAQVALNNKLMNRPNTVLSPNSVQNLTGYNSKIYQAYMTSPAWASYQKGGAVRRFNGGGAAAAARFMKAGRVSTTTGYDIKGGKTGADTQYIPSLNLALQPGEDLYVVPKEAVPEMDATVAQFDRNSNPAKIQSNIKKSVGPKVTFITLPNKVVSAPSKSNDSVGSPGTPKIPQFSVVMESSMRQEVANALGIGDLV